LAEAKSLAVKITKMLALSDWNEIIEKITDVEKNDCGDYVACVGTNTVYIAAKYGMSQLLTTKSGIEYGRGNMKINVPLDFPFLHDDRIPAIAVHKKIGPLALSTYLLTIDGKSWRY
jgi:hypothetical protein|tara:strand:- start:56 stop:406 length:351 start_codon:yes stop_codon:yes gene_type:complete